MAWQGPGPRRSERGCTAAVAACIIQGYGLFATNWGLRSPNSNTNNAYNVNTDGTLNNNNVYNPNFAARPALMEYRVRVPKGKAEDHHQRRPYPIVGGGLVRADQRRG